MNRISRFAEGVLEACWLTALIVAPLYFNTYSSRVFEPDKIALVRSLALLALAAWAVKLIADGGPRFEHIKSANFRSLAGWREVPLLLPVAGLVVIYLIATLLSIAPNISLWGSYQRMQGLFSTFSYIVLFAALVANLRRRAQVERLITVVCVTSLPVSVYAILQRYQLDPLPWGGDTVERVTGHMGNAIFIAAYLIMSALAVLGRVVTSFRAVMLNADHLVVNTFRAAIYIFIFAVNLVAIWFSQSRGPQLGLLAGLFFFFVLLALYYRLRWLVLTTVGVGVALAAFLVVLNLPNGPLAGLAETRGLNRLAQVFDEVQGRTGTGRVRVLIWSGVVEMMMPHPPLETPEGQPDFWNPIRPLIGYGPEAMLIAYNRFYPPELGQLEARNASPDRSHNETFDALAFTGLIGLIIHLSLFVSVFYYSLKWLGLIDSPARRNVFMLLVLGSGALTTVALVAWQGPQLFGVSLPFGMVLGLIAFLTLYALLPSAEKHVAELEPWRAVLLITLLGAILAHFTEIHFGIAIASTRTHFWIFLGALLVLGWVWPQLKASEAREAASPATTAAAPAAARGKSSSGRRRSSAAESARAVAGRTDGLRTAAPITPVAASANLLALLFTTLGFTFIINNQRATDAFSVIWNALTLLPRPTGVVEVSLAILGLMLLTWLMGGVLVYTEEAQEATRSGRQWLEGLGASLGLGAAATLVVWLIFGSTLAQAATATPRSVDEVVLQVSGLIPMYYTLMLLGLLAWAWVLRPHVVANLRARAGGSALAWVGYLGLPLAAIVLSVALNMQVIVADVVYKVGQQFDERGNAPVAVELFRRALQLAPSQDFYYLFLGRAYLNASNQVEPAQRDTYFQTAENELRRARALNPLNTDHTANLGRLNRQWALISQTPEAARERALKADEFYAQAVRLSPRNVGLWNEWGALKYQLLEDGAGAEEKLRQSLRLDDTFDQTYQFLGDLYVWQARRETDPARQKELFAQAEAVYQQGIAAAARGRSTSALGLQLGLANVYVSTNQIQPAIDAYLKVAQINAGAGQWQVYRALAELYRQSGDNAQARNFGEQALAAAPEAEKANVQNWLSTLP
jgi:tetratricopeptide (TPR) repeat protein